MIKRYKKWKNWRKYNTNGRLYHFLVLVGLAHSPTFEVLYYDVGSYVVNGFANSISYDKDIDIFEKDEEMYKKVQKLCRDMADISKLRAANEIIRNQIRGNELRSSVITGGRHA